MTDERIRVLRVIDRLNVGGPTLQAAVLSSGLDPTRFDQRLLTGTLAPDEGDFVGLRAPDLGATVIPGLGRAPRPWDDARAWWAIAHVMREFRPHIVHTHKAKAGVLGRTAAWATGVPATVHTFHGHLLHGYFSPSTTKVIVAVERLLARHTTRLVAVGGQVRDELLAAGIGRPEQYSVVPPGVDLSAPPPPADARACLGLSPTGAVVSYIGRLAPVKRPDRFVDLAASLSSSHPEAQFVVVGDGELLDAARTEAHELGARCVFLGWRNDVEAVYAASDVVVITSDNEGMPVSLMEAALSGTPAVTTRVGSAPEVVHDGITGFVTEPALEPLTAAVAKLLDDPSLRKDMGDAARDYARQRFAGERLVADITTLYESIAAEVESKRSVRRRSATKDQTRK